MRRRRRYLKVLCVQFRPFSQRISKLYRRLYQFSEVCFESFEAAILQKSREHLILMVVFSGSVGHNAWIACIKDVKESSPEVFWTSHLRSIYVERLGENNVISCNNVIRQVSVKWKGRNILLTCIIKLNIPLIISTDEQFIIIMNNWGNKLPKNDCKTKILFTIEAVTRSCSIRKFFLKISQN